MYICKRIRDVREDSDKPQKQIAEVLGIKQQQYSRYETEPMKFRFIISSPLQDITTYLSTIWWALLTRRESLINPKPPKATCFMAGVLWVAFLYV